MVPARTAAANREVLQMNYRPRASRSFRQLCSATSKQFVLVAASIFGIVCFGGANAKDLVLAWDIPQDTSNITGYEVCYGTETGNYPFSVDASANGAATNTQTVRNLAEGTTWRFVVRSRNHDPSLTSGYSNEAIADGTPPTTASGLAATAVSTTQMNLSWTASTDDVGVSGYQVWRCQGASCSNFAQIATASGSSYSNTGLTSGTTYRYEVRATDGAGNLSGYSNIATATTQTAGDTQVPTAASGSDGDGREHESD